MNTVVIIKPRRQTKGGHFESIEESIRQTIWDLENIVHEQVYQRHEDLKNKLLEIKNKANGKSSRTSNKRGSRSNFN